MSGKKEQSLIEQRREKLAELRKQKGGAYPNRFRRNVLARSLHSKYASHTKSELKDLAKNVKVAGRIMARRSMGSSTFVTLRDMSGDIQLFVKKDDIGGQAYADFGHWDIGDIIGVQGVLMRTNTGELSVAVRKVLMLAKSLRPLPEKYHGLADTEIRHRQRYLDLLMNEDSRRTFQMRSRLIAFIRSFFEKAGFEEVETPMMQILPGGAKARPFATHHNALDLDLYLRIAPELYLKRMVVGGFEKVYEINRNFRNEGLSTSHNPEFTMLEFYQAYTDYRGLMKLTEKLLRAACKKVCGSEQVRYRDTEIDFSKAFERMTIAEAVLKFNPELSDADLTDHQALRRHLTVVEQARSDEADDAMRDDDDAGKLLVEIFEKTVEDKLMQPTFVTGYPAVVSPLARCNDEDANLVDRFELFIGGQEIANGFSELNDPEDQARRFRQQAEERRAGDAEAMVYDKDYITALEYGLPPTAGEGIGIDRLTMILTGSNSIRDVILFPLLKPKSS